MMNEWSFSHNRKITEEDRHPLVSTLAGLLFIQLYIFVSSFPQTIASQELVYILVLKLFPIVGAGIMLIHFHVLRKENIYFFINFILMALTFILASINFFITSIMLYIFICICSNGMLLLLHFGLKKIAFELKYYTYNRSFIWACLVPICLIVQSFISNIIFLYSIFVIALFLFGRVMYYTNEYLVDLNNRWIPKIQLEIPMILWWLGAIYIFILLVIKF